MRSIKNVLVAIFCVLAILGLLAGIVFLTDGGTSTDLKTFYIKYNGNSIMSSVNKILLEPSDENRFDVVYLLDPNKTNAYNVKITSNPSVSFDYFAGDELYRFTDMDLTELFDINMYDTYFTVNGNTSIEKILSEYHGGAEITFDTDFVDDQDFFCLTVNSNLNSSKVFVYFNTQLYVYVDGVTIPGSIVF